MQRNKTDVSLTISDIAHLARLVRKMVRVHDQRSPNILVLFEQLKRLFPKLHLRKVEDADMPGAEARAYPPQWIVKIRKGVHEGLLRGDTGARWTFAHELGHILLQHPGKPFRKRSANSDLIEEQAHIFAAEMLAPSDLAGKYRTANEIALNFQISPEAARRRSAEIQLGERIDRAASGHQTTTTNVETGELEELAVTIFAAVSTTLAERTPQFQIEPHANNLFGASLLTAKGAQLLFDAYRSLRPNLGDSELLLAACLASAMLAMSPLREIGICNAEAEIAAKSNEICARIAVELLLKTELSGWEKCIDQTVLRTAGVAFTFDYLVAFVQRTESLIVEASPMKLLKSLPNHLDYNGDRDISWREIHRIDYAAKLISAWSFKR